jgi:hypothetical protein
MKKIIIILSLLGFCSPSLAATVGGADIALPEEAAYLKKDAMKRALDTYEAYINLKAGMDMEFVIKRKLSSSDEVANIELDGQNYIFKFSNNFNNIAEPYIKIGTSNLNVEWTQNGRDVKVETTGDLMWGAGIKATIYELKDIGVKLTLDAQYREFDLDVDEVTVGGSASNLTNKNFDIKEWQTALLASKRFILPVGLRDYYIVPYGGLTFSSLEANISVEDTSMGEPYVLYSTYDASDSNTIGVVLGCDVMPSLLSWYILNFELKFMNELALSIGGTIKF